MAQVDLRDRARDRRALRRGVLAVVIVASIALGAATLTSFGKRADDHHYRFLATYGNTNGIPYTLLVPLPGDPDLRAVWRFLGNGTAAVEPSQYGLVLRISSDSNITVSAELDTWRDLPAGFSTEGSSPSGHPAVRLFLESSQPALGSWAKVSLTKSDPTWTIDRTAQGDLGADWVTMEILQEQVYTHVRERGP